MEKPLRMVGYGPQIDEFIVGMNRAAEKAVPFAKEIFWDAIGADDLRRRPQNTQRQRHRGHRIFQIQDFEETPNGLPPSVKEVMNQVGRQSAVQ